jgi:hypothetical protein
MKADTDAERRRIWAMLSSGLYTEVHPRADSHEQVQALVRRLRTEGRDLEAKLVIAGVTLAPVEHNDIKQACASCMYFAIRQRHCVLPELDLPVEPQWSCRLWRI